MIKNILAPIYLSIKNIVSNRCLVVVFMGLGVAFVSCQKNSEKQLKQIKEDQAMNIEKSENVELLYSDSGQVKLRILAPVMLRNKSNRSPSVEMPKGVKGFSYAPNGVLASTLRSNYAIRRENEATLESRGNVVVVTAKGDTINTEQITWYEREQRIRSKKFVSIHTPKEIIYGDGLDANQEFTKYRIVNIRGIVSVKTP